MIKDLKLAFRLLKYGLQGKSMLMLFGIFMVLGITMECMATNVMDNMGAIYMVLCPTYITQMIITGTISLYIGSSPYKKRLQTSIPTEVAYLLSLLCFGLFITIRFCRLYFGKTELTDELLKHSLYGIIMVALLVFILQIYGSIAYKSYILSLIVFLPMFVFLFVGQGWIQGKIENLPALDAFLGTGPVVITVTAVLIITLGAVAAYAITCAMYKRDIDPKIYKRILARA